MEKINSFLMSDDEKAIYLKRDQWCHDQESVQDEIFQLGAHATSYFTPFKPLYLFEVKKTSVLEVFQSVFVRDGAFSLFRFFENHPRPWATGTALVVHERLAWMVPTQWQGHVYFFRQNSIQASAKTAAAKVYLSGYAHEEVLTKDEFRQGLELLDLQQSELVWLVQDHSIRDEQYQVNQSSYSFELNKILQKSSEHNKAASWNHFYQSAQTGQSLLSLDPYLLMNADSHVEFHFRSVGGDFVEWPLHASSIDAKVLEEKQLSPFHQVVIHQTLSKNIKDKQKYFEDQKIKLREFILNENEKMKGLEDRSFGLMGVSPELANFIGSLARMK